MYEHSELVKGVTSGVVAGAGVIILPSTQGNPIGLILGITAITVGGLAICSQLLVRALRLRAKQKAE